LVDGNPHDIPWLEPDFWIHPQNDSAGRAGCNHVTGFEGKSRRQVFDNIKAVKNEMFGIEL
jgi:hypothetical protein